MQDKNWLRVCKQIMLRKQEIKKELNNLNKEKANLDKQLLEGNVWKTE